MDRHQIRIAHTLDQARQQGLVDVFPSRHHGQEVRLVRYQQVLVEVQDLLLEGNRLLVRHLAEVMDLQPDLIRMRRLQWLPVSAEYPPSHEAIGPGASVNRWEMRA